MVALSISDFVGLESAFSASTFVSLRHRRRARFSAIEAHWAYGYDLLK